MRIRRLASLVSILAALALALWALWLEPASLRVKEIDMPLAWPYARPLRVTVVSDLHVGAPYQGLAHLHSTVDRINATTPDLICIPGDFVTVTWLGKRFAMGGVLGGVFTPPEPIARELSRLRAPAGVVAVLGNQDRRLRGHSVQHALVGAGIRVLEDTAIVLETPGGRLWVAGVSDFWSGPHDLVRTLRAVTDTGTPVLLLTHNPDLFPRIPARVTLTLAGHTHGGQVRFPLLGALIVPSKYGQRYAAGSVVEGGRHLFVSTGIGTSNVPIRLGVPPTIFVLTLHSPGGNAHR